MESNLEMFGQAVPTVKAQATGGLRFDWAMTLVSFWWMGGLFVDGWAHSNIPQLETFFTPWHAIFYSGYVAVGLTLVFRVLYNLRQEAPRAGHATPWLALVKKSLPGNSWVKAIPSGYELTLLGLVIFGICGIGDLTWHVFLGIERNTEALLSPTHLGLALGIGLALSGPIRAAWRRPQGVASWRALGPALVSLTFTFCLLSFFAVYASPTVTPWPVIFGSVDSTSSRGITAILLFTVLMMGCVLLALRRWRLPFGTFVLLLGVNGALMAVFAPRSVVISLPTGLLTGLAADVIYRLLQPSVKQIASVRLFAFLVPAIFYTLYFIDLAITGPVFYTSGIRWSAPFWAGAPVIAGIVSCLLSLAMFPPSAPSEESAKE